MHASNKGEKNFNVKIKKDLQNYIQKAVILFETLQLFPFVETKKTLNVLVFGAFIKSRELEKLHALAECNLEQFKE